ncbi:jhamt [Trichonephila clavata]|uniref:Jhamt n=1 Tax=Trichonephila clavata TaxID=2740835 RepID=A0A8X6M786_TRICU|nr:jhamt [Trichonephila clavata]
MVESRDRQKHGAIISFFTNFGTIRLQYSICKNVCRRISVERFIRRCRHGHRLRCSTELLSSYTDAVSRCETLIAVDKDSTVYEKAHFRERRIQFCVGDIKDRDSLKSYEGKMDKVISTSTFHQIIDKEMAFRNVYRLLKPGGEAGFFFCVNSCTCKLLMALSEIPEYEAILQDSCVENLYSPEHGRQYYREMLEKIGFKHVQAFEEEKRLPFPTDKYFKG